LALQHKIDLDDISAAGFASGPMVDVMLPADVAGLVGWSEHLHYGDESIGAALANLDILLGVLFADDGCEQGLFGEVMALADSRPIAIYQTGQERLIKTGDE
jgi:hypothetical protein